MKIMSFNTQHCENFISKKIDFEAVAGAITDFGADVVGLNEMRGAGEHPSYTAQTEKLAALTGMNYYFAKAIDVPKGGPYGNALLSKYPIVSAETIPVPDPAPEGRVKGGYYETRCLLKAKLENGLTVLVIHFGLNPDEQRNAADTVLQNIEDEKCVLMGDFNVTPEKELLDPIRERMIDTADLSENEVLSLKNNPVKAYGTTLAAAMIMGNKIITVSIGDGGCFLVKGGEGSVESFGPVTVVYTKERQTADAYIERAAYETADEYTVRVATSDGVEQSVILGHGALRITPEELYEEILRAEEDMRPFLEHP